MSKGEKAEEGNGVDLHALEGFAKSYSELGMFGGREYLYTWMGIRKPL
jgi:hypothetical protein